jgi:two-component system C4-dicarboxylate transport response regulator DctD
LAQLIAHDWPGNVRELRNAAERFVLLGKLTQLSDAPSTTPTNSSLSVQVAEFEKAAIESALLENSGSIKQTMEQLNVPRKTLYDKMQRYQIDKDIYKENGS